MINRLTLASWRCNRRRVCRLHHHRQARQTHSVLGGLRNRREQADYRSPYGPDDPLFPATALTADSNSGFKATGFERRPWKSTEPVRKIVNQAFKEANLTAFGPHAFRHMLARHIAKTCISVAELVATSQNLGHSDVLTTLRSYGQISRERQRALVTGVTEADGLDD